MVASWSSVRMTMTLCTVHRTDMSEAKDLLLKNRLFEPLHIYSTTRELQDACLLFQNKV